MARDAVKKAGAVATDLPDTTPCRKYRGDRLQGPRASRNSQTIERLLEINRYFCSGPSGPLEPGQVFVVAEDESPPGKPESQNAPDQRKFSDPKNADRSLDVGDTRCGGYC